MTDILRNLPFACCLWDFEVRCPYMLTGFSKTELWLTAAVIKPKVFEFAVDVSDRT